MRCPAYVCWSLAHGPADPGTHGDEPARWRPTIVVGFGEGRPGACPPEADGGEGPGASNASVYTARAFVGAGGLTSAATRGHGVQVVSLATGTQCAGADRLQRDALTLHDSHAEALARRALVAALQADVHALQQVGEPLWLRDEGYSGFLSVEWSKSKS